MDEIEHRVHRIAGTEPAEWEAAVRGKLEPVKAMALDELEIEAPYLRKLCGY